jgi:hypothetical protein
VIAEGQLQEKRTSKNNSNIDSTTVALLSETDFLFLLTVLLLSCFTFLPFEFRFIRISTGNLFSSKTYLGQFLHLVNIKTNRGKTFLSA